MSKMTAIYAKAIMFVWLFWITKVKVLNPRHNCSYLITAVYKIISVADILLPFLTFQILNLFKWKLKIVHMY